MFLDETHETHRAQVTGRYRLVHVAGARIPPGTATVDLGVPGSICIQPSFDQPAPPGARPLPLTPDHGAQAAA